MVSAASRETWVALMEDKKLVELMFDRPDQGRLVGDIFLGRVDTVLPGIQAAFVDIGTEKAGFLHASDLAAGDADPDPQGNGGRRSRDRKGPPIQDVLQRGQEVLVQVTKESIGTKGPRLTAQISIPGRFLVYMPGSSHVGVSRKIEDREERVRLKELAREVVGSREGGVIVRTVGEELTRKTFKAEFKRLHSNWKKIQRRAKSNRPPHEVHREAKLISGVIRDLFNDQLDLLTVDDRAIYKEIRRYLREVDSDHLDRVRYYGGDLPLFDNFGIQDTIERASRNRVDLPSGGHIVIEPTEALVSIDVNTGRYTGRGRKDPEETILRTNLDAAREIAAQLRLRDIGGIIVVDFIDMESGENRNRVLHELKSHLGRDRARTKAFEVSDLGLIEMTRQRVRPSLSQSLTELCPGCGGSGRLPTPVTVVRKIERSLLRAGALGKERNIMVRVHPGVALEIMESEPDFFRRLSGSTKVELDMRDDPTLRRDAFKLLSGPARADVTSKYAEAN